MSDGSSMAGKTLITGPFYPRIGARLGHCLFYEPGYWLSHPVEMLLPVKITDSGIKWTGYQGLASHGGTIGLMLALWIYSRRVKLKFLTVLDNIAIATPLAGCFIRLGNLMNGEIETGV